MEAFNGGVPPSVPVVVGTLGLAPRGGERSSGPLARRVPLPRVLFNHGLTRQTGVLTVEREISVRTIHFVSGSVVWAESTDPGQRFSEWIVRLGGVSAEKAEEASRLVRSGVCRYGEALLRTGAVGPMELASLAEDFVTDLVYTAFEWRRGTFEFQRAVAGSAPFEPPVQIARPIRIERLIFSGFERLEDTSLAAAWLGDLSAPRSFVADPFAYAEAARLDTRHVALLTRIATGCFSVAEAMQFGILDPEETIRFLGALDATGDLVTI